MQHDFVVRYGGRKSSADALDGAFKLGIAEWLKGSTPVTDEVVVVHAVLADGLVADEALAEVDALHEAERLEFLEDAVDAGPGYAPGAIAQQIFDLKS